MTDELTEKYIEKLRPLIELAKKANGLRTQNTPQHEASREYTRLLVEYKDSGGSLTVLAKELGVAYSGIRRRVYLADTADESTKLRRSHATEEEVAAAVARVKRAKAVGVRQYHEQLSIEYYRNGISLGKIARGLGITNSSPLYYGIHRHKRRQDTGR